MKKSCISFLLFLILIVSAIGINLPKAVDYKEEYLRIHIRANSSSESDQAVKYLIKERVVNYLTPYLSKCDTKVKAVETLNQKENEIEKIADEVLAQNGFSYKSDALIKNELFPTRVYDKFTLEQGYYDALIINLGTGEGENWWCVVYPPLCFTGEGPNYHYKSKIKEIIDNFYINQSKEDK